MYHSEDIFDRTFAATPLFKAIKNGDNKASLICINAGDDVKVKCSVSGMTYIHVIMKYAISLNETKYVPILYQLSNADAPLDVQDKKGDRPIQLSIKYSLLELMEALIKCGVDYIPVENEETFQKLQSPFAYEMINRYRMFSPGYWDAVDMDKAFRVNVLVKSWCRINISKSDTTLIEYSKMKNASEKIIKQLIDNEATIEFAHATIAGDDARMKHLLDHYNIDLSSSDMSHKRSFFEPFSPLSFYGAAIKYGHKNVLSILRNTTRNDSVHENKSNVSSSICSIS